ncbi:MAG: hypothetical protein HOP29_08075 [Phycisphaerales bacterium]|nr:hypothetical protein [Phycisphaerales bacterium]
MGALAVVRPAAIVPRTDLLDRLTERDMNIGLDIFRGLSSGQIARKYRMSREMAWMIRKGDRRPQIRQFVECQAAEFLETFKLRLWALLDGSVRLMNKAIRMAERGEQTRDILRVATTVHKVYGSFLTVEFQRAAEREAMERIVDSIGRGVEPRFT